jgi:DnaJ homolog subfamily C member 19
MIPLLLGAALLVVLLLGADAFSKAKVASIKRLLAWVAALGGISLAAIMLLTGRAGGAIAGALFAAPLAWSWWLESRGPQRRPPPGRAASSGPRMSRAEALDILGLAEGATEADIRAAYKRLMLAVHPDHGGSARLAAQLNQARTVLLGK